MNQGDYEGDLEFEIESDLQTLLTAAGSEQGL